MTRTGEKALQFTCLVHVNNRKSFFKNKKICRFAHFMITRDQNKVQQVQVLPKVRETTQVLSAPWTSATTTTIKRDVDYFSKNNVWHAVYNLHTTGNFLLI